MSNVILLTVIAFFPVISATPSCKDVKIGFQSSGCCGADESKEATCFTDNAAQWQRKVWDTLYVYNEVEGPKAKIDQGNLLEGSWQDLPLFNVGTKMTELADNAYNVDGNPAYDLFKRFTNEVTIPKYLMYCPPTLGQFLALIMPSVGYNFRLSDGSLTVDHPDFTNLYKHIQLCYKIEGDLGHDLESGALSWDAWSPVSPSKSTNATAIDLAPTNDVVTGWITQIHKSVANLTKMFIDVDEGKYFRFYTWVLLRYHLQKGSHLRSGTVGPGYPMYEFHDDADKLEIGTLFGTNTNVIYYGTDGTEGGYQSGANFTSNAADTLRNSINQQNGWTGTMTRLYNFYNAGPYGGIYGGEYLAGNSFDNDVKTWAYMWGNADFPSITSMCRPKALPVPIETLAFVQYLQAQRLIQSSTEAAAATEE